MSEGLETGDGAAAAVRPRGLLGYGTSFWLVFWATFALNSSSNLFVLYPLQLLHFGASAAVIGTVIGTWSLASLAARPAASPLIEWLGRRRTAMWLLWADVFALALYIPIHSLGIRIYAVRALHGAIEGTARVALFAMVFDLLPEGHEGEAMSVFSTCGMGSAAIAPLFGEFLIRAFGFTAFFAAALVLAAIAGALARLTADDSRSAAAVRGENPAEAPPGYRTIFRDARLLPVWIATLSFGLAVSCRLSFVAPFATERGVEQFAWYFTIYSIVAIFARIGGGWLMDHFGIERMLVPSMLTLALGIALIAGTGHFGMLYAAAILGGLGHAYVYPALSAMVIARTRGNAIGRSSIVYQSLYDLGAMAGPYSLGAVAMLFGYGPMFVLSGVMAVAGAVYFAAVEPGSRVRGLA
ncbi:MAG TPA: MFS transporter [Candidatus Binataceae bacterium]|nr:MFS transporter [Candidatus Binataceae bacterium]